MSQLSTFMDQQFLHFNARETVDAARGWRRLLDAGGEMLLTLAGAMSSAELGVSLSEMIRERKVHGICCTGANLEEDLFNLFARDEYRIVPHYRDLSPEAEAELRDAGFNRVTDTCIPESVMRHMEGALLRLWKEADDQGISRSPWDFVCDLLDQPGIDAHFQIDRSRSWVLAAKEMNIPVYAPGWEDSTMGNIFCARVMAGVLSRHDIVKTGTAQLQHLAEWYVERAESNTPVGFFQIGGGIAGDFPICVVPMLIQDLNRDIPFWAYFAQIGDSVTSYGSYSGAVPNEKITWFKLDVDTPKFMINSDASIVAPLVFAYVLGH